MSTYERQLSPTAAEVVGFAVSGFVIAVGVMFASIIALFGPLILALFFLVLGTQLLAYPFRRRFTFPDGAPIMFAGWMIALPLAAILVPACDGAAALTAWWTSGAFPADGLAVGLAIAGVAIVHLVATVIVFVRLYGRTPASAKFSGELPRKGLALGTLMFSFYFMGLALTVAPLGTVLYMVLNFRHQQDMETLSRLFLILAAVPPVLSGLGLIRRGFWLCEIQRMIDGLPTSTVGAAALGPIELKGTAHGLEGSEPDAPILLHRRSMDVEQTVVNDFELDDGTGRVRVRVPEDSLPGVDRHILLQRGEQGGGLDVEFKLMPGDPVYVLGTYAAPDGKPEVQPWTPPFGRFFVPFVNRFFGQDWSFGAGLDLDAAMGLQFSSEVFAIADSEEVDLRRAVARHWRWSMLLGVLLVVLPFSLLVYLLQ